MCYSIAGKFSLFNEYNIYLWAENSLTTFIVSTKYKKSGLNAKFLGIELEY